MLPFALVVIAAFLLMPATASADGLPAVGIDANPLGVPGGHVVYVTERARQNTRLIQKARYGGAMRERTVSGSFSVPAVAYDGSPGGLSADGRKLILISPRTRYPRKRTTFAVVDTRRLSVRPAISLRGDFSFDAISPDGRTMYLIEYDPRDFGKYAVRAYDMDVGGLLRAPVVDPDEADEPMTGIPVTRVPGPDGRWQYTLYDDAAHSFVHALDTSGRAAVCIDLDVPKAWGSTLSLHGNHLEVIGKSARVLASIDTRTHKLIFPKQPARRSADASTSWLPLAIPTALLLLLLLAAGTRRRMLKRPAAEPITEAWERPRTDTPRPPDHLAR